MNIDTSKLKSTHWSGLLRQMICDGDCYDFAKNISYQEFWDNCQRGDWLLFFTVKEGSTPHKLIVKAACQCARLALPYGKKDELRPLQAIEATERWLEDKATIEEVKLAATAAYAYAVDITSYAAYAAYAVYSASAAYSAATAAYAYAVDITSYAAYAVADAASYTAASDAAVKKEMQQKTADIVRSIIPIPTQAVNKFERLLKLKPFW